MHISRTSPLLVRLILAWFVLTLGAAVAAPMVQPAGMALVCAEGGVKIVLVDGDGAVMQGKGHALDCPLCLPAALPPVQALPRTPVAQPSSAAVDVNPAVHAVARAGAPLPPRGPPACA